ncbi:MAG: hypothetical protein LBG11_09340 [Bifidobacteriaceae bacterium]|nr:hypothetical protein [Bifidobacteriaceae bacterium]
MEFPALDITGQAGSPREVDEVAPEVAALVLDADPADVGVDVEVELPTVLEAAWPGLARTRRRLARPRRTPPVFLAPALARRTGLTVAGLAARRCRPSPAPSDHTRPR